MQTTLAAFHGIPDGRKQPRSAGTASPLTHADEHPITPRRIAISTASALHRISNNRPGVIVAHARRVVEAGSRSSSISRTSHGDSESGPANTRYATTHDWMKHSTGHVIDELIQRADEARQSLPQLSPRVLINPPGLMADPPNSAPRPGVRDSSLPKCSAPLLCTALPSAAGWRESKN